MYLLLAFALPFSAINNKSISVKRSTFVLRLFNADCHANAGAERNFQNEFHIFEGTYL